MMMKLCQIYGNILLLSLNSVLFTEDLEQISPFSLHTLLLVGKFGLLNLGKQRNLLCRLLQ
jgi:hypothetical protein